MLASLLCASDGRFDSSAMYSLDMICSLGSHTYSINPIQRGKEIQKNGRLHVHKLKILTHWTTGEAPQKCVKFSCQIKFGAPPFAPKEKLWRRQHPEVIMSL